MAHSDVHHLVFRINSQIHSVSLTSLVLIHLLIHLSTHLCHHHHSQHPLLLLSFTPGSKHTISTNPSHLNTSGTPLLDCLNGSLDRTGLIMLISLFLVLFSFKFYFDFV